MRKPSISNVLSGLKTRLDYKNSLTIQSSDGHLFDMSFIFNHPIDEAVLRIYENVPEDYKNYLRLHDGTKFFSSEYGALFGIYSLEEALGIVEKVKMGEYVPMEYKDVWFPIGYVQDIGGLYIDLSTDNHHLIVVGISIYDLLCDFPTWLDRMIRVNGEIYWEWASKEL
ncbi:hypothetical protein ACFQPF_03685 [Fictibacillus iocasae]|uniref:Knr4/Smi1-like domain-containing protein n=1 Tax=Fictibacillus iocasae TaxID=2715437 RepID=A0ABW2NQ02_9BACL